MSVPLSILIDRTEAGLYRATLPDHQEIVVTADTLDRLFSTLALELDPIIVRTFMSVELSTAEDAPDGDDGFDADLAYVLDKNAELYRRLAR